MRNASLLWLEPLRAEDAAEMVDALLAESLPGVAARGDCRPREGNPFFVEELIGTLIDRGVLERRNGGWSVNRLPTAFDIPDTVQAVVAARLDLPRGREGLQAAAVAGRIFWKARWCASSGRSPTSSYPRRGTSSAAAPTRRWRENASTRSSTR
jgi:predicted ATPase